MKDHYPLLATALLLAATGLTLPVHAATCPDQIDAGDCVANDLQPTGTEIINGPTACTAGETIAVDVRIKFENGGGANERYSVGFFVGDNGESAIGGSSCTFDSLQPVGSPIDLVGGSGGFLELNGDACGDISKSDVTYKDISLSNVACSDQDGDGQVDISYVLTWANNGNQENCTDPLDPDQFTPTPPKCQSELEYNLPIIVEPPPSIAVGKGANPSRLREPGGLVEYVFTIINTSPSATDPVTITSVIDNPYGDLSTQTSCTLPLTLARGESVSCSWTTTVTGVRDDTFPDTVTVSGVDDEGTPVSASDSAVVTIIAGDSLPLPGDLRLQKYAIPPQVFEPGGPVTYAVLLDNVSETRLFINSLVDDIYGDLDGKGSCLLPIILEGDGSLYGCSFVENVSGQPGDTITDIIVATGNDVLPLRTELQASDDATVTIIDRPSHLTLRKIANPSVVLEGSNTTVNYRLYIQNASTVDTIEVERILDSRVGALGATCGAPFLLQPGEFVTCDFSDQVDGNVGDFVTNIAVAEGRDDDGVLVLAEDAATVRVVGAEPSLEVTKIALPPFALISGSNVLYAIAIQNTSNAADPVTLTSLTDVVQSDPPVTDPNLALRCPFSLPRVLAPGERVICTYVESVSGADTNPANSDLVNTVTVTGVDDDGQAVSASDDASVRFVAASTAAGALTVTKTATPVELPEPGGDVTYTVQVASAGDVLRPITITSLVDDLYGDLRTLGNCNSLFTTLNPGEVAECSFTIATSGNPGDVITDTVLGTATFPTLGGGTGITSDSDSASVTIIDVPSALQIVKTANPTNLVEPGGDVSFSFEIGNSSAVDSITLDTVVDNVYGDLNARGDCDFNRTLAPAESYSCSFTAEVSGTGGTQELNTVVATGTDDDGLEVQASAQATVTIADAVPSIRARKVASSRIVSAPGAEVAFSFIVRNTSDVDEVTIDSLTDNVFGDLDGQGDCSLPQTVPAGGEFRCAITETVTGAEGSAHINTLSASGASTDGTPVSAEASALVLFTGVMEAIPVGGRWALLLLTGGVAVLGVRYLQRRRRRVAVDR